MPQENTVVPLIQPQNPPLRRLISEIRIGTDRHRHDMGDLAELARSIDEQGLLQPIGIFPDGELVFGERRLRACRDHLHWEYIDVRVVDVTSRVQGELHENVMRKQFTPSERVAIFRSLETRGAGRPQLILPPREELKPNVDEAAKLAGFAGRGTAYRAEAVVKKGIPALVEAMDKKEIKITTAAQIAALPKAEQPQQLEAEKIRAKRPILRDRRAPPAQPRRTGSSRSTAVARKPEPPAEPELKILSFEEAAVIEAETIRKAVERREADKDARLAAQAARRTTLKSVAEQAGPFHMFGQQMWPIPAASHARYSFDQLLFSSLFFHSFWSLLQPRMNEHWDASRHRSTAITLRTYMKHLRMFVGRRMAEGTDERKEITGFIQVFEMLCDAYERNPTGQFDILHDVCLKRDPTVY